MNVVEKTWIHQHMYATTINRPSTMVKTTLTTKIMEKKKGIKIKSWLKISTKVIRMKCFEGKYIVLLPKRSLTKYL